MSTRGGLSLVPRMGARTRLLDAGDGNPAIQSTSKLKASTQTRPARLLRQNLEPGTGCCDVIIGVQGVRYSHLLAPSKPFPQSQTHSALFPRASHLPHPHAPASASAMSPRSYSLFLCLRTLNSRNREERIDSEVRGRGAGVNRGQQEGQGEQEGEKRGGALLPL